MTRLFAASLTAMMSLAATGYAQVKDLADLFPARTRTYVEVNQIDQIVKALRPLLKGSVVEDLPGSLEKMRARLDDDQYHYIRLMEILVFFSPEGLSEASRLKGAALAVTDLPKQPGKDPEIAGVLLTGESNLPAMFLRGFLTMDRFRKVGEVEGVPIYRQKYRVFDKFEEKRFDGAPPPLPPAAQARKPEYRERGPAIAMMPGAVVLASTTEAAGDVIRRIKGKGKDSLASTAHFQKAAAQRKQAGVFVYSELETLTAILTELHRPYPAKIMEGKASPPRDLPPEKDDKKPAETPMENLLSSMKAFKSVTANLTLKDGAFEMRGAVSFDPKVTSGWPDFFTSRTVDLNVFQYAPPSARTAFSIPLPSGDDFWNKLGKMAPTFETHLSLTLGPGALDKITHMAIIEVAPLDAKTKAMGPTWLLQTKDADAARALAKDLAVNLKMPAAAKDHAVAVGMDRALVDLVLATGAAKKGMLGDPRSGEVLKNHDKAHLLLAWSIGQGIVDQLKGEAERVRGFREPPPKFFEKEKFQEVALQPNQGPNTQQQRYAKELERLAGELAKTLENVPPLTFSVTKKDDRLIVYARQTKLPDMASRLINVLVEWDLYSSVYGYRFRDRFRGPEVAPVPDIDIRPLPPLGKEAK